MKKVNLKVIKRNNYVYQALSLPKICNINPRSIYNKRKEFTTFVEQQEIDVVFMSESWERQYLPLHQIFELDDFTIKSNVHQRVDVGGRPALFVNKWKYDVQNLTNSLIKIPWGVEAIWCLLTPKNVTNDSLIQKIVCCAIYSKPDSRKKTLLLDHIAESYNLLCTKYPKGLHFIYAGDTNDLKLDGILSLDSRFVQIVKKPTRLNPPAILDPIVMSLANYYQEPKYLEPLDSDQDKIGAPSDHRIICCEPISTVNNRAINTTREVSFRPFPQSGIDKFRDWLIDKDWSEIYAIKSANEKAEAFQNILVKQLDEVFPIKISKFKSTDQPWFNAKLKKLDRKRKRIYNRERKSIKWKHLNQQFIDEVKKAKSSFYKKSVANLKQTNPSKWYSALKRLSSYDQRLHEIPRVEEINDFSDDEQAELIADKFQRFQMSMNP